MTEETTVTDETAETTDAAPEPDAAEPAGDPGGADGARPTTDLGALEEEGEIAADYLEGLLDILDYDGDIDMDVEGDRAAVAIREGDRLKNLVGPKGETLDALQELARLAVLQKTGNRSRLMLDIDDFRARRRAALVDQARAVIERVRDSGESEKLAPMTPFERKVVHDEVAAADGVTSESEGEEPQRRVVVRPA